ncbi:NAD(P)-binding protein [Polyplosphaeria fusca]|uniref:NAD(P)-binding protein n=1 Tax=Polyplosphaeria fusca TaxID=682080 RepID=A0A9P4QMX8_9PLEO|nr:NAD(P)-binding protein [Polyplosphaeria fusca]
MSFPPYYGISFTPTTHHTIPPSLLPTPTTLRAPSIAVVTGAGKGLGYHISLAFARAGCTGLSISSRTSSDLSTLRTHLLQINPDLDILTTVTDTQSDDSVSALAAAVRQKWGRVDTVIANAGIISAYVRSSSALSDGQTNLPVGLIEDGDWARVLDVNLLGTWRVARAFLPLLSETKDGAQTLVVCTSLAAHSVDSAITPIAYNVSKMACNRLVEHVDSDHRGKDGVHAYALHPGAVVTPQTQGHRGGVWDEVAAGRILGDDEGLAGAWCVWLSGEKRGWLSGRYVSCGWDVEELEAKREEIEERDLLKFRMVV